MTCIIALKHNKKVYMAGDSGAIGTNEWSVSPDPKVFVIDNEIAFGFTSSFRMGQVLQYKFTMPTRQRGDSDDKYIRVSVIDRIIEVFTENKVITNVEGRPLECGTFLIGYRGEIYEVQDDMSVLRNALPYMSIGAGEDVANGAMHVLCRDKKTIEPHAVLNQALQTVTEFCNSVRSPFHIVELK